MNPFLILLFLSSIPLQISCRIPIPPSSFNLSNSSKTPQNRTTTFLENCLAILQNKKSIGDDIDYHASFSYYRGHNMSTSIFNHFTQTKGLVTQTWNFYATESSWDFYIKLFDGNYTDQKAVLLSVYIEPDINVTIDEENATVKAENTAIDIYFENITNYYYKVCTGNLYIFIVDRSTNRAPTKIDPSNLDQYSKQFMFITHDEGCSFSFTTSLFNQLYQISTQDKLICMLGPLAYILFSLSSIYIPKPNRRKVSVGTLRLLYIFPWYVLIYATFWFYNQNLSYDILYWVSPFAIAMAISMIKHLIELHQSDAWKWCYIMIGPGVGFICSLIPYLSNLLACLYMFPQVVLKFKERKIRYRFLSAFEIGNWICLSAWMLYINLYPTNIFLAAPQPILVIIFFSIILLQIVILLGLQFFVKRPRIFKYTFAVDASSEREKLLTEQCAICLGHFEFDTNEKLYRTPCSHYFHSDCLKQWGGKKLECPCCRKRLPDLVYPID